MSDINLNQFKIDIQKKLGLTIEKPIHLKILQESVENTTGEYIGYNTLRRFFGFLNETSPNSNTLNILSRYLGKNSFNDYKKNYLKDNDWISWIRIIEIENREIILESDILWLMNQKYSHDYVAFIKVKYDCGYLADQGIFFSPTAPSTHPHWVKWTGSNPNGATELK
jgi:hypothetical protein